MIFNCWRSNFGDKVRQPLKIISGYYLTFLRGVFRTKIIFEIKLPIVLPGFSMSS